MAFLVAVGGAAQEDESYSVQLDGRKTWTFRYGLGDALGLAASGLVAGALTLDQSLAVDIHAEALSILSVEAHFDDRQADSLQSLSIYLDTDHLDGVLGDFTAVGIGGLTTYGKKMKGLQLEYTLGEAVLTGIASKLEGISESQTFVGERAHGEVTFSEYTDTDPPRLRSYKRRSEGLYAYPLSVFYVEEFSDVALEFDAAEPLRRVLLDHGVEYLYGVLAGEGSFLLDEWEFEVLGEKEGAQILILSQDALDLVRDRLETAIERYNEQNELNGDEEKEYPFSEGTAYELEFLEGVAASVGVSVDGELHRILEDAARRRFFDLGRDSVLADSLSVSVSPDGSTYESIDDPAYADYSVELFADAGILEVGFPEAFFTEESAIRVEFDYTVTGGVFMLGLSIIPGSERVTLNGEPLSRDVDYMIDYEIGMLVLLIEIGETDVLRVDYERFSGGIFGSGADYATYFYGLTLDWPVSEHLTIQASLIQSAEDPGSVSDPESVKTMPNRHTVAGISGVVSLDDFRADFLVAYSRDRFPFDDNARIHEANEIAAIATTGGYTLFGHRGGLTVLRAGEWSTYGTTHGLAGRSVQAIAAGDETVFIGTSAGLSVVALDGLSPLDRVANWSSYYADDDTGLPNASVTAVLYKDGVLWIGTEDGLASVSLEAIDEPEEWIRFDEVDLGPIRGLDGDGQTLYVGTDDGLYAYSLATQTWNRLQGTEGLAVADLSLFGGTLYVATGRGLRSYRDGIGTGWLLLGEAVYAVEASDGSVLFGTQDGLFDAEVGEAVLAGPPVTALHRHGDVVWVGTRADSAYELTIWTYGASLTAYGQDETGIDGRDPFAYVDADADADEHTVEGLIERASFRHSADGFSVSGSFENDSPSYRSIGSTSRNDRLGWDLAATWELGSDAKLSVSHRYDVVGRLSEEPESSTTNDLSLEWTFGPVLTLNGRLETTNNETGHRGAESTDASYRFSLRDEFFAGLLDAGIAWSDAYAWDDELGAPRRDTKLAAHADAELLPGWEARLDWSRPVQSDVGEWSGSERLTVETDAGWDVQGAGLAFDYTLGWHRAIPGGIGSRTHEIEFDVDVNPLEASGWKITPGATVGATSDESSLDLDGRMTARIQRGELSIRGALRGGLSGLGEAVVRENEKLSVTASYSGIETVNPSLTYSVDRQVALYEAQRQRTIGHSLSGRLTWSPGAAQQDELSFAWACKGLPEDPQITVRFENSYRLDLREWIGDSGAGSGYPAVGVRLDTDVNSRRTDGELDLDATTSGWLNVALSPMWSGSFGISYRGGTNSSGGFYHSLLLELTLAIDF